MESWNICQETLFMRRAIYVKFHHPSNPMKSFIIIFKMNQTFFTGFESLLYQKSTLLSTSSKRFSTTFKEAQPQSYASEGKFIPNSCEFSWFFIHRTSTEPGFEPSLLLTRVYIFFDWKVNIFVFVKPLHFFNKVKKFLIASS